MKCTQCNGFGYIDNLEGDGLRCPKCNGTGECEPFDTDVELDKLYPTKQTNEEWFDMLPTEAKAKTIVCLAVNSMQKWQKGLIDSDVGEIVRWLKAPHDWNEWLKEKHHEMQKV